MSEFRLGVVERAYEIANSGAAASVNEVRMLLTREGYLDAVAQLSGRAVRKSLRELCVAAQQRKFAAANS